MSEDEPEQAKTGRKLATAAALLLFSSHRLPGVRGYELRRRLGGKYLKIIESLNHRLNAIGLRVKVVFQTTRPGEEPREEDFEKARFFITLSDTLSLSEVVAAGWRIDDLAVLSATLAHLFTRGGKAPQSEVMDLLETKLPRWRVEAALERFTRRGYLYRSDDKVLYVGWRTLAEVEQRELVKAVTEIPSALRTDQATPDKPEGEAT